MFTDDSMRQLRPTPVPLAAVPLLLVGHVDALMPKRIRPPDAGDRKDEHRLRPHPSTDGELVGVWLTKSQYLSLFNRAKALGQSMTVTIDNWLSTDPAPGGRAAYRSWTPEHHALAINLDLTPKQVGALTGRRASAVSVYRSRLAKAGTIPPPSQYHRTAVPAMLQLVPPAPPTPQVVDPSPGVLTCQVCDTNPATTTLRPKGEPPLPICEACLGA